MQPLSILIVEDDPVQQEILRLQLNNLPYTIDTVANGVDALQTLYTMPSALVILDLWLPQMSGIEVLRDIRADESLRDVKVLVMTAVPPMLAPADAALADAVIHRPVMGDRLTQLVKGLLALA